MSKTRLSKAGVPRRDGRRLTVFREQLTTINLEIRQHVAGKKPGRVVFFDKEDLRWVFDQAKGRCHYCGIVLTVKGAKESKPYFRFWTPLRKGGMVRKENLITYCWFCMDNNRFLPRNRPVERIFDFNTVPDIIQRLVQEIIDANKCEPEYDRLYQENIKRLKRELNFAIQEFTQTLLYNPRPEAEDVEIQRRRDDDNSAADLVAAMASTKDESELTELRVQLVQLLKEINKSREYVVLNF